MTGRKPAGFTLCDLAIKACHTSRTPRQYGTACATAIRCFRIANWVYA